MCIANENKKVKTLHILEYLLNISEIVHLNRCLLCWHILIVNHNIIRTKWLEIGPAV